MTLLLQTESHVRTRKARRCAARQQALQAALASALAETEADVQAGTFRLPDVPMAANAAAESAPSPGPAGAEAAAAFASATAAAADAAGLSEEEHVRFSNEIYVPTHSISDALLFQIRERSRAEARAALAALAARLRARARRTPADDDLPSDTVLEQLRKLVPSEFLVAWAAWTTASDLIPPDRITDAVRWAVWAVYTIAAFFYVLWQLFEARHEEECRDFMIEEDAEVEAVVEDFRGSSVAWTPSGALASPPRRIAPTAWAPTWTRSGVFESPPRPTQRPVESIAWTRSGVFESPPRPLLRPVESNGLHSTDSSAVSLFQFIYDEHWHRAPLLGVLGTERSDAGAEFRSAQSTHGVRSAASAALSAGASPSDTWLCMQAVVSAVAFMLLSAATGDVYLKPNFVLWAVLALVPLFPLFAQFVLPRRGRRRRRR